MASSRRVRVSRIVQKRKILRLLPMMLIGNNGKKEYFSLLSISGQDKKPECWPGATKGEFNLARRKKSTYCKSIVEEVGWCVTPI